MTYYGHALYSQHILIKNRVTGVRNTCGETVELPMTIGLHQGPALSSYLFAMIMNELTTHIREEVPWCMLFVDDKVLVDESRDNVNAKLGRWLEALESKGFKIARTKIEYGLQLQLVYTKS